MEATRPEIIQTLLKMRNLQLESTKSDYARFLQLAQNATDEMNSSHIVSVRLSRRARYLTEQEMMQNGSLRLIFGFYSKFQPPPAAASITFAERQQADESLSFFEIVIFCRNFQVIPKLVTKEELKFLWRTVNIERIRNGIPAKESIDYDEFKTFLVKIALFSYNKPGMIMLIEAICGFIPDHNVMVESLANYLHLNNQDKVREIIDTSGRQSASRFNSRSKGDKPQNRAGHEMLHDVRARRLSNALAAEIGSKYEDKVLHMKTSKFQGLNFYDEFDDDELDYLTTFANKKGKKGKLKDTDERMLVISDRTLHYQGLKIASVIRARARAESAARRGSERITSADAIELLTEITRDGSLTDSQKQKLHETSEKVMGLHHRRPDDDSTVSPQDPQQRIFTLGKIANVGGAIISEGQEHALESFDRTLSAYFNKFSKFSFGNGVTQDDDSEFQHSNGPFIDFGRVQVGSRLSIRIDITNICYENVEIDVMTSDFQSDDIVITTIPRSFAPGLQTYAFINFTTKEVPQPVIGCIEIMAIPLRSHAKKNNTIQNVSICCPVFYRVQRHLPQVAISSSAPLFSSRSPLARAPSLRQNEIALDEGTCTIQTLPNLTTKYVGIKPKLEVSFEKPNPLWDGGKDHGHSTTTQSYNEKSHSLPMARQHGYTVAVHSPTRTIWTREVKTATGGSRQHEKWQETKAVMRTLDAFGPAINNRHSVV